MLKKLIGRVSPPAPNPDAPERVSGDSQSQAAFDDEWRLGYHTPPARLPKGGLPLKTLSVAGELSPSAKPDPAAPAVTERAARRMHTDARRAHKAARIASMRDVDSFARADFTPAELIAQDWLTLVQVKRIVAEVTVYSFTGTVVAEGIWTPTTSAHLLDELKTNPLDPQFKLEVAVMARKARAQAVEMRRRTVADDAHRARLEQSAVELDAFANALEGATYRQ